jgi:hypothetical protein
MNPRGLNKMDNVNIGRCRINFAQDAKGKIKLDITAEYETPEISALMLSKAIDLARETAEAKGLKILEAISND